MNTFPFSDWIVAAIFILCLAVTVIGALIAAFTKRIIRSVCGLAIASLGLAGLFYFLNSPFLALMEILIYIGAVCVTIIFGVMLAEPDEPAPENVQRPFPVISPLISLAIGGGVFIGIAWLSLKQVWTAPAAVTGNGSIEAIGELLLTKYSVPFELISLVLLVAILGALVIARSGRTQENEEVRMKKSE
jgi:NADH:ubiquinone oxidoreductase subunit 6 (subunit J)